MTSSSRLLKCGSVLVDESPAVIADSASEAEPAGQPGTAAEGSKTACAENGEEIRAAMIIADARMKAKAIYEQAKKEACFEGYRQAAEKGAAEFARQRKEAEEKAAESVQSFQDELSREYEKAVGERNAEALDFAFALAEKILGMKIDRNSSVFSGLFGRPEEKPPGQAAESPKETQPLEASGMEAAGPGAEEDGMVIDFPARADEAAAEPGQEISGAFDEAAAAQAVGSAFFDELPSGGGQEPENPEPGFGDIKMLDAINLRKLFKTVNLRDAVLSLKGEDYAEEILRKLPKRMQSTIREELDFLGPVSGQDAELSRRNIARTMRRLNKAGEITFERP